MRDEVEEYAEEYDIPPKGARYCLDHPSALGPLQAAMDEETHPARKRHNGQPFGHASVEHDGEYVIEKVCRDGSRHIVMRPGRWR